MGAVVFMYTSKKKTLDILTIQNIYMIQEINIFEPKTLTLI